MTSEELAEGSQDTRLRPALRRSTSGTLSRDSAPAMTTAREYDPDSDFLRVRDFLSITYQAFGRPLNWRIERWNWARYHPGMFEGESARKIEFWEQAVRIWETGAQEIVGVVNVESPQYGRAYLQRHPGHTTLLGEMLDYAEGALTDRENGVLRCSAYVYDEHFQALLRSRGYRQQLEHPEYDSEFMIEGLPEVTLPRGYAVQSMAEGGDMALRCKVQGLGFDHPDPADWTTVSAYRRVQAAPDYREDLDLFVRGPDGDYVSCGILWLDERNRLGICEPMCTHPSYRRMGFGRAVMMEGVRRVAALGALRVQVGSGQRFYEAIGFERKYRSYRWTRNC